MDIVQTLKEKGITKVKVGIIDVDGVFRGKYISLDKFRGAVDKGFGFCDVVFGWDSSDVLYENAGVTYTGWHTGYPDAQARIDLGTLRYVPWEPNTALFLADFVTPDGAPLGVCPRQLLKRICSRSVKMGYNPIFASEFEYFLFQESPETLADKGFQNLTPLSPGWFGYSVLRASYAGDLTHDIIDSMSEYGCELEGFHTETGPGVYETAIKYGPALQAADRAVLFKTGLKEICNRHGVTACFMAKPDARYPGNGGHLHQSLWDTAGTHNLFHDADGSHQMSTLFRHYLGGVYAMAREFSAFYMPTINSYKRRVPGTWSPINVTWGVENRTSSIRIIPGSESATRLEMRICGADINPYIAYAACLASGLYGIENQIEPPEPMLGNAYSDAAANSPAIPASLDRAVDLLDQSEVARSLLGSEFVDHFVATRRWEVKQYEKAVTDWELKRYFEII